MKEKKNESLIFACESAENRCRSNVRAYVWPLFRRCKTHLQFESVLMSFSTRWTCVHATTVNELSHESFALIFFSINWILIYFILWYLLAAYHMHSVDFKQKLSLTSLWYFCCCFCFAAFDFILHKFVNFVEYRLCNRHCTILTFSRSQTIGIILRTLVQFFYDQNNFFTFYVCA